ncbi:MAG TPA: DUF5107 domain-containing protein, partial [Phycisphaerae bacterium]|nr:DUF5107 domain-containing protein [Phycisphaerae bacterium]
MRNDPLIHEEPLTLPTYVIGPPERHAIFYTGRAYQGARGPVYPYPLLDRLSDRREDRTYRAIYLENEYLQFCVLPELGGRIFSATDKTNGYDFAYRQHVVKPALIGMLGAWISGGVEWNIPHHHRPTTFLPTDWCVREADGGGRTLWVGELEWRHRMRWAVGMTIWPGRSYVRIDTRISNRTPLAHSMLCFVNWAVHVNEQYQVVFPPSVRWGAQHAKCEFVSWPVGDGTYAGTDYRGVDLSWWRNHPHHVSVFACNEREDFFGGYDHARGAGTACIADHHVWPGMKFFTFGNGPSGRMWDRVLTDSDGPYLELMSGAWSDNQPDYSWIQPYETRRARQYWYPVRELGAFQNANRDAAVSVAQTPDGRVRAAFNATGRHDDAEVRVSVGGREVLRQRTAIGPDRPFACEAPLPAGAAWTDVRVSLHAGGAELIRYRPAPAPQTPKPVPVVPPGEPETFATVEELHLAGQRIEQLNSPTLEAEPYYQEALRRDPADSRANTATGLLAIKRGRFEQAREHLQRAADRLTCNHTRPRDGEALYYLGVARRSLGDAEAAADAFGQAAWTSAFRAASLHQLAEMAVARGDFPSALGAVEKSLTYNSDNVKALLLRAVALRKLGRFDEALAAIERAAGIDPLDHWAACERARCLAGQDRTEQADRAWDELAGLLRGEVQSWLELACDYEACGQWAEAAEVLQVYLDRHDGSSGGWRDHPAFEAPPAGTADPMVAYALAFYRHKQGGADAAGTAPPAPPTEAAGDGCFPFRTESIRWLGHALEGAPGDGRAAALLGNLLYDLQPAEAVAAWEDACRIHGGHGWVHRNLAFAYRRRDGDLDGAFGSIERAIARDGDDPRLLMERDQLLEAHAADPAGRLALLEGRADLVEQRDDVLLRQIALHVLLGQYDRALELLNGRNWHIWEGRELGV